MKRPARTLAAAALGLLTAGPLAMAAETEAFGHRASGSYDPVAARAAEFELYSRLEDRQVGSGLDRPLLVELGQRELARLEARIPGERPIRVGLKKGLQQRLVLGRDLTPRFGAVEASADGGFVWTGPVRVDGASALRLQFAGFDLAPGAELYLYSAAGQARGPYTGRGLGERGSFWSHTIFAGEAIVQLHSPPGAGVSRLTIQRAGYMGSKFVLARHARGETSDFVAQAFCTFNASCIENVNCGSPDAAVTPARDAVAQILFASGGGLFICSGGLLADTDASTERPLFLTANHCISKASEAASTEAFFQFEVACGAACVPFDNGDFPSTVGATILKTGKRSDYTLMELSEPAPAGSAFLGWDATPIADSGGVPLYRISHPGGAPQAYSEQVVDTEKVTCAGWPRGRWIYSADTFGGTEGGSSGSPVVNASGEVVGQLTGACGFNVNDPCDAESNATVDGAFAAYFSQVAPFLDPGGGSCKQKGESCSADGECCSGKCRGPSSGKTCK